MLIISLSTILDFQTQCHVVGKKSLSDIFLNLNEFKVAWLLFFDICDKLSFSGALLLKEGVKTLTLNKADMGW